MDIVEASFSNLLSQFGLAFGWHLIEVLDGLPLFISVHRSAHVTPVHRLEHPGNHFLVLCWLWRHTVKHDINCLQNIKPLNQCGLLNAILYNFFCFDYITAGANCLKISGLFNLFKAKPMYHLTICLYTTTWQSIILMILLKCTWVFNKKKQYDMYP